VRAALCEVLVRLPVYRPYVTAGEPPGEADAAMLESAAEGAEQACVSPDEARAVALVRDLALGRHGDGADQRDFAARFAQVSSALRAKSTEDTAFYRYAALLSACEVGGEPGDPAVSPEDFHAYCALRQRDWPTGANALSTHDTKRSGDVRAAVALLTECPGRWAAFLADPQVAAATDRAPDPHTAWTAWQTSFGLGEPHAAEESGERLTGWLLKSVREAGLRTTWTEQDAAYEEAVRRFAESLSEAPVTAALHELFAVLAPYVRMNVLGTALLHLTMPGVPDVYQGTERTYRALTDPDNRAPVHFPDAADLEAAGAPGPRRELGQEKLRLTAAALRLRRAYPEWFLESASYQPLYAEGEAAGHCLAFARSGQAVTAVTRLGLRLHEAGGWRDTELPLPEGTWSDLLSGRSVHGRCRVAGLFADGPVALLVRTG
jgi:(1->4)-alpha-D-glucan 1-alpha-D-glucosylmutase